MSRILASRARALVLAFAVLTSLAAAADRPTSRHPPADDTYTITSTLELVNPVDPSVMADDFQDVRVLRQTPESTTVEITYYPLHNPPVGENRTWRRDYAGMTEHLRSNPAENWDEPMQRDLLAELRAAGIEPDKLSDKQLVEQVSRWAMKRSRTTQAFAIWAVHYPDGQPAVHPALRAAFDKQKPDSSWTDQRMFDEEALGRSMFYGKVRGSCTSSSIYLTTIFRALGIPTRTVFCIPPFDPNDKKQAELFYAAINHHRVRETVRAALGGMSGFANHLFNEVYVGHRWVRLNYSTLGQPILDARYFGLLTHIYTSADLSQAPLSETWGMRYFNYSASGQPRLSSVNPYRLISVTDRFGPNAQVDNPAASTAELRTVTISRLYLTDSPDLPPWITKARGDFMIRFDEWLPGKNYTQMRVFSQNASRDFLLTAPGQPDLHARLNGSSWSKGDGSFQAYSLDIDRADRGKIAPGVAYTLKPLNTGDTYRWQLAPDLGPLTLATARAK